MFLCPLLTSFEFRVYRRKTQSQRMSGKGIHCTIYAELADLLYLCKGRNLQNLHRLRSHHQNMMHIVWWIELTNLIKTCVCTMCIILEGKTRTIAPKSSAAVSATRNSKAASNMVGSCLAEHRNLPPPPPSTYFEKKFCKGRWGSFCVIILP